VVFNNGNWFRYTNVLTSIVSSAIQHIHAQHKPAHCSMLMHGHETTFVLTAMTSLPVSVSVLGIGVVEGLKYRYQWYR